jgi:hypothetical protein
VLGKAKGPRRSSRSGFPLQLLDHRFHQPCVARHLHPPGLYCPINPGQHIGRQAQHNRRGFGWCGWFGSRAGNAASFAAESTVNAVISKRFAKRQQMQWTKRGAHLLLQIRTRALDGTLRPLFEKWYPGLANDNSAAQGAAAA